MTSDDYPYWTEEELAENDTDAILAALEQKYNLDVYRADLADYDDVDWEAGF